MSRGVMVLFVSLVESVKSAMPPRRDERNEKFFSVSDKVDNLFCALFFVVAWLRLHFIIVFFFVVFVVVIIVWFQAGRLVIVKFVVVAVFVNATLKMAFPPMRFLTLLVAIVTGLAAGTAR